MDELVILNNNQVVTSSLRVAEVFNKRHDHTLRDIESFREDVPNFGEMFYESLSKDSYGRDRKIYFMNRDGFTLLAMGFTGRRALGWKLKYIEAFNKMEESLKQASTVLTEEQKLQLAIFQAETVDEAGQAAANLDRYRRKQLEAKQREIDHKKEVIRGVTDDIDIYTKRNILNKVVRYKGANFAERWNELYERYKEVYSIDLKARCDGYNLKQKKKKDQLSTVKYAEKFGHIDNLYKIALKLYETDINEILNRLQKIA